mgnify:CR=1 FL=1
MKEDYSKKGYMKLNEIDGKLTEHIKEDIKTFAEMNKSLIKIQTTLENHIMSRMQTLKVIGIIIAAMSAVIGLIIAIKL